MALEILEGTWEEIIAAYSTELAGRRVRLTVLPNEKPVMLDVALADLLEAAEQLEFDPSTEPNSPVPNSFEAHLIDKYRKQGFLKL